MTNWLQQLGPRSDFARGVGVLVGGTAGAQALTLLAAPLLTRLYTPEDFGVLAIFVSLLTLCAVAAAGRYELAIPLPENDTDAANIAVVGLLCVGASSILLTLITFFWANSIATRLGAPYMAPYLWLLPVGVLFIGTYNVGHAWAVRTKAFKTIARTRFEQAAATVTAQLAGFTLGAVALIGGHALGQAIGALRLVRFTTTEVKRQRIRWRRMRFIAHRYRRFPIYSTWTALSNTASLQLVPILFASLLGVTIAGLYALTLRVLSVPAGLIGDAIGSVFLSEAPRARRENKLTQLVEGLHLKLALAGAIPLAIVMIGGPTIFELVFGENWRQAGIYAQWMAPWLYLQFQWTPLSMIGSVMELQRALFVAHTSTLLVRVGLILGLASAGASANTIVLGFSLASALCYLLIKLWFLGKAGCKRGRLLLIDALIISPFAAYLLIL